MNNSHSTKFLSLLGVGLNRSRLARLREEYKADVDLDTKAKRTVVLRVLMSYSAVANWNSALAFFIAGFGIAMTLKSMWLWATCLMMITIFTTTNETELSFNSKSFKIYRMYVTTLVITACVYSIAFDNLNQGPQILNVVPYLGNYPLIIGGAISLVTLVALGNKVYRSKSKADPTQQVFYVLATMMIYLSSYLFNAGLLILPFLLMDILLTAAIFMISSGKRKPALA
jgi:hypothetical protein